MFVYEVIPAAAESLTVGTAMFTTNGAANTVSTHWMWSTGTTIATSRACQIQALYGQGRGAGLTAISGISLRILKTAVIGTAGTASTPRPRDSAAQAAITTFTTAPTQGTGAVSNLLSIGFGAAGPGGWVSPNPDSNIVFVTGGVAVHGVGYLNSVSGTTALAFDMLIEFQE